MASSVTPAGCGKASRIAVAVDGSPFSRCAAFWAASNFPGANIHLVTVIEGAPLASLVPADLGGRDEYVGKIKAAMAESKDKMVALAKELAHVGLVDADKIHAATAPTSGSSANCEDISKTLLNFINGERIEMLCVGTRGIGGIARALSVFTGMGSTAEYLCKHATVPLTIVPPMERS